MTKIIADACCNHLNHLPIIDSMIKQAAEIGIDYIKFQVFQAEDLSKDFPDYNNAYEYYKNLELSDDTIRFICRQCAQYNIKPLFTVFNGKALQRTVPYCSSIKIASPDANNWELILEAVKYAHELFVSTGMHNDEEIISLRENINTENTKLFYCISKYPTHLDEIDFEKMLPFDGFSDHTLGTEAAKRAITNGVAYIEKHFTLGRDLPGNDHRISATVDEFKDIVAHRNYIKKSGIYKKRWNP